MLHKGGPQGKTGARQQRDVKAQNAAQHMLGGAYCQKCNAWKGQLGLEPTIGLTLPTSSTSFAKLKESSDRTEPCGSTSQTRMSL